MSPLNPTIGHNQGPPLADDEIDVLVPDPQVAEEFGVTLMTIWRWDHDSALGFPPPVKIRRRNYRSRRQLESFKRRAENAVRQASKRKSGASS